jgi:hydrogenase expression/formation protein HypC
VCLAVPGELISIDESLQSDGELPADTLLRRMGKVSFGGIIKRVSLAYVPEAIIGDYVIVHVGFALSIIDRVEARQTLEYFQLIMEVPTIEIA